MSIWMLSQSYTSSAKPFADFCSQSKVDATGLVCCLYVIAIGKVCRSREFCTRSAPPEQHYVFRKCVAPYWLDTEQAC